MNLFSDEDVEDMVRQLRRIYEAKAAAYALEKYLKAVKEKNNLLADYWHAVAASFR